jgi:hypothetical protein
MFLKNTHSALLPTESNADPRNGIAGQRLFQIAATLEIPAVLKRGDLFARKERFQTRIIFQNSMIHACNYNACYLIHHFLKSFYFCFQRELRALGNVYS